MRYSYDILVPADTGQDDPYTENLRLTPGTLTQVIVRFRAGCHNRVYVAMYESLFQIVPAYGGEAIYADNQTIVIPMNYPVIEPPYELLVQAWSPGTFYDHTLSLWLDLLEMTVPVQISLADQLKHLIGIT